MHYRIDAYLVHGNPRLQIKEAESGTVRLVWDYPKRPETKPDSEQALAQSLATEEALHKLFRGLFLLTTTQYLNSQVKGD
ncbi:hypothetical protein [Nitrococcus mobilis]|uniref:Uncharacterized protein n=1 Tax=Nitrococcus mobilis Nb-231 TaxID=314278 RepID=A4BV29_9GAMM|nr:hypothetical protein [Nitrococcus mobilis]EAR20450.1 hypothetical protein NB231_14016 [Nitrococcus mobilis Nb-231]